MRPSVIVLRKMLCRKKKLSKAQIFVTFFDEIFFDRNNMSSDLP